MAATISDFKVCECMRVVMWWIDKSCNRRHEWYDATALADSYDGVLFVDECHIERLLALGWLQCDDSDTGGYRLTEESPGGIHDCGYEWPTVKLATCASIRSGRIQ